MNSNPGYYFSGKYTQYKKDNFTSLQGLLSDKVNCVLFDKIGTLYAGTASGLCRLEGEKFTGVFTETITDSVECLYLLENGKLAVSSGKNLYFADKDKIQLINTFEDKIVDIAENCTSLWILTENKIINTDSTGKNISLNRELEGGKGISLAVSDKDIYVVTQTNISIVHGKRREWKNILPRFASMPQNSIHAITFDEAGYLWIGSEDGASIYDNSSLWLNPDKIRTLPKNPIYKIVTDKSGGRYFASDVGIIYQKKGALKYFCAERWVLDNKVNDIAVTDDGKVWFAATDKGISRITSFETTLAHKAQYYDDLIEKYHIRYNFTAVRRVDNNDISTGHIEISDNDGLWTACYVAAESFRYAATGSKEALEKARRGIQAMLFLTRVTGIPGFTARAVRYPGEEGFGDGNKEWALSEDGTCEWKGETSSDEMTGHFFGMSTFYDLCANEEEKAEIKTALCNIMEHILRNNYRLVDRDGLPTTWAAWDPEMLNHDDRWFFEKGINSLELLAFFKVCYHVSGDEKYKEMYEKFVSKYHYPLNAMQHKIRDAHICHIDDNLAFLITFTLLRLEENEALRSLYLCGMEDHWQYERIEKQPLFCFIHAICTGRDEDLVEGVQSLREMPYDLTFYNMENSKRKDLEYDTEQEEWFEQPQLVRPLPFDERNIHRPDGNSFSADLKSYDLCQEGTVYLLPYWMGRYYGILKEDDKETK